MKIETIFLCETVESHPDNQKLNLIGLLDYFYCDHLPLFNQPCFIVMRIRFEKREQGEHKLNIQIIDADGKVIYRFPIVHPVKFLRNDFYSIETLAYRMRNIKFENYGQYEIWLSVDDEEQAMTPFFIIEKPIASA